MKHSRSSFFPLVVVVLLLSCGEDGKKELREFAKIEAAIGMVAGASTFDRGIRLEQLEKIKVSSKNVAELQQMCAAAYRSFNKAVGLLEAARQRTEAVENNVKTLKAKKESGGELTPDEENGVLEMSRTAAKSLKSVTEELDVAEEMVAACQAKRAALRRTLTNR